MRLNFFSGTEDKYLAGKSCATSNPYTLFYPKPKILKTGIWDFFSTPWLD